MLRRHLTIPHRFVLIDDGSIGGDREDMERFPFWGFPPVSGAAQNNYARLKLLHRSAREIGDRILVLDLDITIRANIDSLITNEPFKGLNVTGSQLQGGMWLCTPGVADEVWQDLPQWVARSADYRGSDQAVLSARFYRSCPIWTWRDGVTTIDSTGRLYSEHLRSRTAVRLRPLEPLTLRRSSEQIPPWRILLSSGSVRPWCVDAPEHLTYVENSNRDTRGTAKGNIGGTDASLRGEAGRNEEPTAQHQASKSVSRSDRKVSAGIRKSARRLRSDGPTGT